MKDKWKEKLRGRKEGRKNEREGNTIKKEKCSVEQIPL